MMAAMGEHRGVLEAHLQQTLKNPALQDGLIQSRDAIRRFFIWV